MTVSSTPGRVIGFCRTFVLGEGKGGQKTDGTFLGSLFGATGVGRKGFSVLENTCRIEVAWEQPSRHFSVDRETDVSNFF